MSTSYHRLKEPITRLRLKTRDGRTRVSVWLDGTYAHALIVKGEFATTVVRMFADEQGDNECPVRTHWAGQRVVVTENVPDLDPEMQLISDYGEIWTVAEIREWAEKSKSKSLSKFKEPMPTA